MTEPSNSNEANEDRLLEDHEYDGIQEFDNPLPKWWLYGFYFTMIWAAIYIPYYHFGGGNLPGEALEADLQAWNEAHPQVELASREELEKRLQDKSSYDRGKKLYDVKCIACHLADGGGLVGPNLTDNYAIHGGQIDEIAKLIYDGVPAKGMLAWGQQLSTEEIYDLAVYVKKLQGTKPAKPKAAEGEKF